MRDWCSSRYNQFLPRDFGVWIEMDGNLISTTRSLTIDRMPVGIHAEDAVCPEGSDCVVSVTSNNGGFTPDAEYTCLFSTPSYG